VVSYGKANEWNAVFTHARAFAFLGCAFAWERRGNVLDCQVCETPIVRAETGNVLWDYRAQPWSMENLWTLCFACNRGKGIREL
jgi:hypothetical protein